MIRLFVLAIFCLVCVIDVTSVALAGPTPVSAFTGDPRARASFVAPKGPLSLGLPETRSAIFLDTSGNDSRIAMTNSAYPWSTIGRIYRDNGNGTHSTCTGTLVGQSVMLTAAHCVLHDGVIEGILFQANYVDGTDHGEASSNWITVERRIRTPTAAATGRWCSCRIRSARRRAGWAWEPLST